MTQQESIDQLRLDYNRLLQRLQSNQRRFDLLARSAFRLQEDERRRLARELHDGLGQNLTALQHLLGLLLEGLAEADQPSRQLAERALKVCRGTLEDTREMSRLLRPQILDDLGLSAALQSLCRSIRENAGLKVELCIDDEPELDSEQQTVVFRIAQESLTNVVRHARAQRVELRLRERARWLTLSIEDDGIGLEQAEGQAPASGHGSGLRGMRERLRLFGGELKLQPGAQGGLRVLALLPLDAQPTTPAE